jgi:hypothetical protein
MENADTGGKTFSYGVETGINGCSQWNFKNTGTMASIPTPFGVAQAPRRALGESVFKESALDRRTGSPFGGGGVYHIGGKWGSQPAS